jgi:8-oxo-dGTP diphosphatase
MTPTKRVLNVTGIVRRGEEILLVRQQDPDDGEGFWTLPGGAVEPGELLGAALAREIREETGIVIDGADHLAMLIEVDDPSYAVVGTIVVFDVSRWAGTPLPADPDGDVIDARFWDGDTACRLLERAPWPSYHEPFVAYLQRRVMRAAVWSYRALSDEDQELVEVIPHR